MSVIGRHNGRRARRAFTLIELIVVMVVTGIIAALGAGIIVEAGRAYSLSLAATDATDDAQFALDRICAELAQLEAQTDITAIGADSITFDLGGTSRTFQKVGSELRRDSSALATGVSTFDLTYYASDGTTALSPADVWRIAVNIAVTRNGVTATLRREVFPRSFRAAYVSWQEQ
jgi:prepilin-type N-terminal cleavage/methylation domain-containing protein